MINLLLMLVWSALGFTLGLFIVGALPALRDHPRTLMAAGAILMPVVWALHAFLPDIRLFGPNLLLMMTAIGLTVAGWEAEVDLERRLDDERRGRLRAQWELRQIKEKADDSPVDLEPAAIANDTSNDKHAPGALPIALDGQESSSIDSH